MMRRLPVAVQFSTMFGVTIGFLLMLEVLRILAAALSDGVVGVKF